MHEILFSLFIIVNLFANCYSIQCYTCEGLYSDLNNNTCSVVSRNDSCLIQIGYAVDTGNWIITMLAFNATADFPGYYVKPKSGSAFFDQYWSITTDVGSRQLWLTRFFCYEDFCNPFSLISQFLKSDISYPTYEFKNDVKQCLVCNASDYNSAEKCKETRVCDACAMTSNQVFNDLYSYLDWSSDCYNLKNTENFGVIFLQFEINTKLVNLYPILRCTDTICATFGFMEKFLNNIEFKY
jgi:hypothetical protein